MSGKTDATPSRAIEPIEADLRNETNTDQLVEPPASPADLDGDGDVDERDAELAEELVDVVQDAEKLADTMDSRVRFDANGMPLHMKWKPKISVKAMLLGAFLDIAVEVILQQAGLIFLDTRDLVEGILQGSILGAAAPLLGSLVGVIWVNNRIAKLRAEVA